MALVSLVRDYIDRMLQDISGMEVLILDPSTVSIVSVVYSQSDLLKKEVFLVETVDNMSRESMSHLKAVYFLRPSLDIIQKLRCQLAAPRFAEYQLFADPHSTQIFCNRAVDGIAAVFLALKKRHVIRYQRTSDIAKHIAQETAGTNGRVISVMEQHVWSAHRPRVPRPLLSLHVRMGDKACEMKVSGFEMYMKLATQIREHFPDLKNIWLSTEMQEKKRQVKKGPTSEELHAVVSELSWF